MDNSTSAHRSTFKSAVKPGLILGTITIVYNTIGGFAHQLGNELYGWVAFIGLGVGTFIYVRKYRNQVAGGQITFGRAYSLGFQIYFYAGLLCSLCYFIYEKYAFPYVLENIQKINEQKIINNKNMTDEQIETSIKMSKAMFENSWVLFITPIVMFALLSLVAALIVATICKKEPQLQAQD